MAVEGRWWSIEGKLWAKAGKNMDRKGWNMNMVGGAGGVHPVYRTGESVLRGPCAPPCGLALNRFFFSLESWCVCFAWAMGVSPFHRDRYLSNLGLARTAPAFVLTMAVFVAETAEGKPDSSSVCLLQVVVVPRSPLLPTTSSGDDVPPMRCCFGTIGVNSHT